MAYMIFCLDTNFKWDFDKGRIKNFKEINENKYIICKYEEYNFAIQELYKQCSTYSDYEGIIFDLDHDKIPIKFFKEYTGEINKIENTKHLFYINKNDVLKIINVKNDKNCFFIGDWRCVPDLILLQ
jgi:hypothetical protein